jgi:hypothetical protein
MGTVGGDDRESPEESPEVGRGAGGVVAGQSLSNASTEATSPTSAGWVMIRNAEAREMSATRLKAKIKDRVRRAMEES